MVRPNIARNGRSLATGSGCDFASSAPGDSPPPGVGTPESSAAPSVGPKASGLGLNGKERYRFSSGDNHGRNGIGRKGNSYRRDGTGPRKWGPKVREFRGPPGNTIGPGRGIELEGWEVWRGLLEG